MRLFRLTVLLLVLFYNSASVKYALMWKQQSFFQSIFDPSFTKETLFERMVEKSCLKLLYRVFQKKWTDFKLLS